MPVVFSTALPAIATITSPAKAFGIPSLSIDGVSAVMNQSETNAAPTPAIPSSTSAEVIESAGDRYSPAGSFGTSLRR